MFRMPWLSSDLAFPLFFVLGFVMSSEEGGLPELEEFFESLKRFNKSADFAGEWPGM